MARQVRLHIVMMRTGRAHKVSIVLTSVLIASIAFISSCDQEEQIVYVPREVPADCPPSAPRGVYAVNLDGAVQICWYPNPEEDIAGYGVYRNDGSDDIYNWIEDVLVEDPEPYEYCYVYDVPSNGEKLYYAVTAFYADYTESDLSYEDVSATPRPEGFLRLYDVAVHSDSCGYDFTSFNSIAQDCSLPSTDIVFDTTGAVNLFMVTTPRVMIQDYGFTSYEWPTGLDAINTAPVDGWSVSGSAEVIEGHCYILRLGEADGLHYVKLWVYEVADGYADFWWAYQTDHDNTDLMPPPLAGGDEDANIIPASGSRETGGKKKIKGFPRGRQVPPTNSSGVQGDDRILQRQNTLP